MHSPRPASIAFGLALMWGWAAQAVEPAVQGTPLRASEWLTEVMEPVAAEGRWERQGPLRSARGVAVGPGGQVAVLAGDGSVWLGDEAGRWRRALVREGRGAEPWGADEDVLRELEARLEEIREEGLGRQAALNALRHELHGHPWFLGSQADGEVAGGVRWEGSALVVGRLDGLWWSEDEGRRWSRALPGEPVVALAHGGGRWAVSTVEGLAVGDHPARLRPIPAPASIHALAVVRGAVWAGSPEGLWRIGRDTERLRAEPVTSLTAMDDSLWVGTADGLLQLAERGQVQSRLGLRGVRALSRIGGQWVATGSGGTWAWAEGSAPAPQPGPLGGEGRALDGSWMAATDGVYRWVPQVEQPAGEAVALGALVEAAVGRPGLREGVGRRGAAALLPAVTVEGSVWTGVALRYSVAWGTQGLRSTPWQIGAQLHWAPGRRRSPEALLALVAPPADGGIELLDGTAFAVAESLGRTPGLRYQEALTHQVIGLHASRTALLRRVTAGPASLHEAVHLRLDLQEVEARLDALTEGALSRGKATDG